MSLYLSRHQIRRVEQLATQRYRIPGLLLMENAGRNAAQRIDAVHGPAGEALILCGPGNNGGDGCVIARHLSNFGWSVRVMMTAPVASCTPDARINCDIVEAMGLVMPADGTLKIWREVLETTTPAAVIVDALLGTGFRGTVRSPLAELIQAVNARPCRAVVAVDVPSGMDCDTGLPSHATVRADMTVTFVALKRGFDSDEAKALTGRLEVADIGAPPVLIEQVLAES